MLTPRSFTFVLTRVAAILMSLVSLVSVATVYGAESGVAVEQFTVNHDADILAGEIHKVSGTSPGLAVVIAGGSGVCERADTASAVPLFLNPETAVVLVDRRGCGKSTGTFTRPGTRNSRWLVPRLAIDLEPVIQHLRAGGFSRVGLIGSSFGGWLAIAAASENQVDFFVAINGGASSVAESDTFDRLTDQGMSIDQAVRATRTVTMPRSYDPDTDLASINVPGLFILAELDDSNPMVLDREHVEFWQQQEKPFALIIVTGANHDLVNLSTGTIDLSWLSEAQAFIAGSPAPVSE
ncbi:MAG: alpha/beta hydrolase [Gammaproteobacteria bacterium]|nr:alpha/beta fold hydrolase [Pseudomonadales bacterium]